MYHPFMFNRSSPVTDHPSDIEYAEGTKNHSILWNPWDWNPKFYKVFRNGTLVASESWNRSAIAVNIDGLDIGTYNFTLIVENQCGNTANDTVLVTVYQSMITTTTTPTATPTLDGINPLTLVLAVGAVVGIVAVIVIVYVKKQG